MPCRDDWGQSYPVENPINKRLEMSNKFLSAALCAVMTYLEHAHPRAYDDIDYREAGITKEELRDWWAKHKVDDAKRKCRELAQKNKAARRQAAIDKLTPAERKLLGVK